MQNYVCGENLRMCIKESVFFPQEQRSWLAPLERWWRQQRIGRPIPRIRSLPPPQLKTTRTISLVNMETASHRPPSAGLGSKKKSSTLLHIELKTPQFEWIRNGTNYITTIILDFFFFFFSLSFSLSLSFSRQRKGLLDSRWTTYPSFSEDLSRISL